MKLRLQTPTLALSLIFTAVLGYGGEFQSLVDSFDSTKTLAGMHHTKTTNPDGTSINFWDAGFEGQAAVAVSLSNPHLAAADAYGNIYVADKSGQSVLKISGDGLIHTYAGTHVAGFNGDGPAAATSLQINNPNGLYVLPNGVVFLLDPGNHRIRRVDLNGEMTTVVNDTDPNWSPSGRGLWVSQDQQIIYYTHEYPPVPPSILANGAVLKKWTPGGGIETICDRGVGFVNPANMDVNPLDGKLYLTDRAEEDSTKMAQGLFRIDGVNQRTRITGNVSNPVAATGQLAVNSFIEEPRGIAFRYDGSYFICGHKDGSIWFVEAGGTLRQYINGSGKKDGYVLPDGRHPPLVDKNYFSQPRAVTLAPNGNLLVMANDSGYLFQVDSASPSYAVNLNLNFARGLPQLEWSGEFGRGYRIESTLNLLQPTLWSPLTAVKSFGGSTKYIDLSGRADPARFYRVLPAR